jgi:methyl-accepting chemotaxis protein
MLRNRGIRTKLLAVLAFPTVVLLIGASLVAAQGFARAGRAASVERLARDAGVIGDVVWSLHAERGQAVAVSSGKATPKTMKPLYAATDRNLMKARDFIGKIDIASLSPAATEAVAASARSHAALPRLRAGLANGSSQPQRVADSYNAIIESDIALPRRIGEALDDRSIGRSLAAYSALESLIESAFQESEVGAAVIAAGGQDRARAVEFATLGRAQREAVQDFRVYATPAQITALDGVLDPRAGQRTAYTGQAAQIVASATGAPLTVQPAQWKSSSTARISALTAQVRSLTVGTADLAAEAASASRSRALLLLAAGLLAIAVLVVLGLALARTITRPLRRLTASAGQVAEDLPRMVERMALPGEEIGVSLPTIDVRSTDEVGQLARAFKNVNDTTVRVAQEQAALRGSIAEMFVNVARRNHVLLSRQLSFIDQLERSEENPDTLEELFRLDHLATRMRRNAESLIVLAGVDAGRRLRRPMPLSDVVRTAVSEIERYDRVDLELRADPAMVGHVALMAAHLIAELLENATQFSNPDTRVVATTTFGPDGVRVTLSDQGLGMTWEEINDANHRIANPPMTDVVGSQRLGFYVVGRLARRLDASVVLAPGLTQGTVVTIDLPPALFVPGSVAELPSAELSAADAPPSTPGQDATPATAGPPDRDPSGGDLSGGGPSGGGPSGGGLSSAGSSSPFAPAPPSPAGGSGRPAVQPRVPVQAAPIGPDAEMVAPTVGAPAADAELAVGTPGHGGGIFSGFWPRRSDGPTAEPAPAPAPTSEPEPTPTRAVAPAPPVGQDPAEDQGYLPSHAQPTAAALVGEPVAAPADLSPLDPAWSAFDEPTDQAGAPVVPEPAARVAPPAAAPPSVRVEPPVVVEPSVRVEPPVVVEPVPPPQPVEATFRPEPEQPPAPQPESQPAEQPVSVSPGFVERRAAPQPVAEPEPLPAAQPMGAAVPSMDVLPARSLGRGLFRRSGKSKPVRPVVRQAAPQGQPKQPHHNRRAIDAIPDPVPAPAAAPPSFAPADPAPAFAPVAGAATISAGPAPGDLFAAPPAAAGPQSPQPQPESAASPVPVSPFAPPQAPSVPAPTSTSSVPTTLRERSAMASRALSELSAASTYSPQAVEKPAPQSLQRRTPLATPAGKLPEAPDESLRGRRGVRNATDVRTMLSGYQAGVERGRTAQSDPPAEEN